MAPPPRTVVRAETDLGAAILANARAFNDTAAALVKVSDDSQPVDGGFHITWTGLRHDTTNSGVMLEAKVHVMEVGVAVLCDVEGFAKLLGCSNARGGVLCLGLRPSCFEPGPNLEPRSREYIYICIRRPRMSLCNSTHLVKPGFCSGTKPLSGCVLHDKWVTDPLRQVYGSAAATLRSLHGLYGSCGRITSRIFGLAGHSSLVVGLYVCNL